MGHDRFTRGNPIISILVSMGDYVRSVSHVFMIYKTHITSYLATSFINIIVIIISPCFRTGITAPPP